MRIENCSKISILIRVYTIYYVGNTEQWIAEATVKRWCEIADVCFFFSFLISFRFAIAAIFFFKEVVIVFRVKLLFSLVINYSFKSFAVLNRLNPNTN